MLRKAHLVGLNPDNRHPEVHEVFHDGLIVAAGDAVDLQHRAGRGGLLTLAHGFGVSRVNQQVDTGARQQDNARTPPVIR